MKAVNHYTPLRVRLEMKYTAHESGCWLWHGKISDKGYGVIQHKKRRVGAHRVAYELYCGPIPEGKELDHLCRVRRCVNPAHLEPVTHLVNVARGLAGRHFSIRQVCKRGHPLKGDNLFFRPNGVRGCRTCRRAATYRCYLRRKKNKKS